MRAIERLLELQRAAFEGTPVAVVVLDANMRLALVNARAATMFGLSGNDTGRPFEELEISHRPVDLRSIIDRAHKERRMTSLRKLQRMLPSGDHTYVDLDVTPLFAPDGTALGTQLSFGDATQTQTLMDELQRMSVALDAAREEIRSTSADLETTNEELQSTVEELETTNEELQSTNEELETMNEELQSTNEELQTMNQELRERGEELNHANSFLGTILATLRSGVAVLDAELVVKAWNRQMEELWGLRASEVEGKHFLNLDIGLPVDTLRGPVRLCLNPDRADAIELVTDCTNRRGKTIRCRITVSPLRAATVSGAMLIVEELKS